MTWEVYEVALDTIRALRPLVEQIARRNPALAAQLRDAASSIPSNLRDGRRRIGKDRFHLWRVAAGSADEVRAHLDVAAAWGDIGASDSAVALELIDRELAMLWRMTRSR